MNTIFLLLIIVLGFVVNTFLINNSQLIEAIFLCLISSVVSVLVDFNGFNIVAYMIALGLWVFTLWWNAVFSPQKISAKIEK
ncbi:MAG: hypothetical protein LBM95_03420 [Lactobacillales bacterium]|jgi:hypothetical protein|nr:hypothetical protein [Lactobacillales bacterium]